MHFYLCVTAVLATALIGIMTIFGIMSRSQKSPKGSLYERLGGVYAIAAVIDRFSDNLIDNPKVGRASPNPHLARWSTERVDRLPGLKWMRTLWVCDITGGPQNYVPTKAGSTHLGLENAHCPLHITSDEFDEVAKILSETMDTFNVPAKEKGEVMSAFAAHKKEVIASSALSVTSCPITRFK